MDELHKVLRKIAIEDDKSAAMRAARKANETHANLSRVEPDLWGQLPRDLRDLIINWRKKEREEKSKANETTPQPKANLAETQQMVDEAMHSLSPEALATIDAFLEDQESSEDDDDNITSTINLVRMTVLDDAPPPDPEDRTPADENQERMDQDSDGDEIPGLVQCGEINDDSSTKPHDESSF